VRSATWIKQCHSVLSKTKFFSNSLISRSFLIVSLIVFLGLPLPLGIQLPSIWSILLITESTSLLSTCRNHLCLVSTIFSTIGVTPTLYLMSSFLILPRLVNKPISYIQQINHHNVCRNLSYVTLSPPLWVYTFKSHEHKISEHMKMQQLYHEKTNSDSEDIISQVARMKHENYHLLTILFQNFNCKRTKSTLWEIRYTLHVNHNRIILDILYIINNSQITYTIKTIKPS